MSSSVEKSPPTIPPEEEDAPPAVAVPEPRPEAKEGDLINNRYRLHRKLGHGGMGSVALVEDTWRGGRLLALKRVRRDRLDARTITILRNEFLALSPLTHPNLARVYDFEVDLATQDYFFTSEYVQGEQLLKVARDFCIADPWDFQRFLEAVGQMLRALEFIHSRGLVHGDVKPENILISGSLSSSRESKSEPLWVKMIDFGLTKREKESGGKRIVGTTYYIAPETILGSLIDRRTDLYSLGVVLYHITTHKLPFTGKSSLAVLRGHIEKNPTPPHQVEPAIPEALSALILRLMEKQPARRFGCALDVIEEINKSFDVSLPFETPETRLSYIKSGGFIARESEMAELTALFESVYRVDRRADLDEDLNLPSLPVPSEVLGDMAPPPSGRMMLIRGESGVGKRRLLKEFRRYAQTQGVHFLEIDCGTAADNPRGQFAELVHAQVRVLSALYPQQAPDPERLEAFLESVEKPRLNPLALRPAVDRLAKKFLMFSRMAPVVLAFIDIQKCDAVLLEFLRALIVRIATNKCPDSQLTIVATAEDDDPDDLLLRPFLAANDLRALIREITLERFNAEEVAKQVATMFGAAGTALKMPFSEKLLHLIYEESDGNPGVVRDIMEFLVSTDRVRRSVPGWVCEEPIERDTIPGKMRRELQERIGQLDAIARRLATGLALLGSGEIEVAARLAEIPPGHIIDAVLGLKKARVIREEVGAGDGGKYMFVHSSARELLYQEIPPEKRPALHDRAGGLLEAHQAASGQKDARLLAFHFLRAGNAQFALKYGMDAARDYAAIHYPRKAIEVYADMRRFAQEDDPAVLRAIDREMARLYMHTGDYRMAVEALQSLSGWKGAAGAAPPAGPDWEQAAVLIDLGAAYCRLGNFRESAGALQEAFRLLKGGGASPELATLLLGFAELYHRKGNYAESLRYCERVMAWEKGVQDAHLEARLYGLLADNHFRLDNKEIAAKFCQKGLELLSSQRSVDNMALTLQQLGRFYTYKGRFQKALKNLQHCAVVNQKIGALDRQADCLREMGAIQLSLDNPQQASQQLGNALSIYERTENLTGKVDTLITRAEALRYLGSYEDAQKDLQTALQGTATLGNQQHAAQAYLTLARIALDHGHTKRAEKLLAQVEQCQESQPDERAPIDLLVLRCQLEVMRGDFTSALDIAVRGSIAGREIGNRLRTAPLLEQLVRLYLVLGRNVEARRSLVALAQIGQRYGLAPVEGRALVLEGMLLASDGKSDAAAQIFEKALGIFRDEKCERDLVQLYLEFGRMQLRAKNFEQAYILFEEGLYLARKLNLAYSRCQLFHQMGLLETAVPEGVFAKAVGYLLSAERYARSVPLLELLWRIRADLGKFYLEGGRVLHAARLLTQAKEDRDQLMAKIPESYRRDYLTAARLGDLDALATEAAALAEVQAKREQAKYPVRDPEAHPYFGLVGQSAPMRELYRKLAALTHREHWVWVSGDAGSGRREVGRAIHRQSLVPEREKVWVYQAQALKSGDLDKFFLDLEAARGGMPEVPRDRTSGQPVDENLSIPGRFTLVVADFEELGAAVQKHLFERVLSESEREDGLRVVATFLSSPQTDKDGPKGARNIIPDLLSRSYPEIKVPPLGQRREDIPLLVEHFLGLATRSKGQAAPQLSNEALDSLAKQPLPGQLAELRDLCEKICRFARSAAVIDVEAMRTAMTPTLRAARRGH